MNVQEIEKKCKELRELQALIEEARAEAENIKGEIKAYMGVCEDLRAGQYRVTYKLVKSERVDIKALREQMPAVARKFTRTNTVRRFCVA